MGKARPNFVNDLRAEVDAYAGTADALALELRLDVAGVIVSRLNALGWTQRDLAEASGMKESFISRVIHSNANCTLGTVAVILSALDVRARLVERAPPRPAKPNEQAQGRPARANRPKRPGSAGGEAA